jgi:hypothetical protein
MVRTRSLNPGFFKNEYLAELPYEARILFAGLWCMADREGRLEDRPKRIKGEVFPYDNIDVEPLLITLARVGLICRYEADGGCYLWIPTFLKHQRPHPNEAPSLIRGMTDVSPRYEALSTKVVSALSVISGISVISDSTDVPPQTTALAEMEKMRTLGYPFDTVLDSRFLSELAAERPDLDMVKEIRKWRVWVEENLSDHKKKINFRARFRTWIDRAYKQPSGIIEDELERLYGLL